MTRDVKASYLVKSEGEEAMRHSNAGLKHASKRAVCYNQRQL
jgi:hypothetical protein